MPLDPPEHVLDPGATSPVWAVWYLEARAMPDRLWFSDGCATAVEAETMAPD